MKYTFYKYQGAGNDFVLLDDREETFLVDRQKIERICHRNFGVGADGLILLQNSNPYDFRMRYFNSDGRESSMCGNGGRCIAQFAFDLGLVQQEMTFEAIDGLHRAVVHPTYVALEMIDVDKVEVYPSHYFLNTGSPHHVQFVDDVQKIDVQKEGAKIRYGAPYFEQGSNVNFVEVDENQTLHIRTYERGVEAETLACGTGVTAAAIAAFSAGKVSKLPIHVKAVGGDLSVQFMLANLRYEQVWLEGPAQFVFEGMITLEN